MATSPDDPIPPPGARQYEFTPAQDQLIADLARKMRFVGFFALLVGGLGVAAMIVALVRQRIAYNLDAIIWLFLGFWTLGAARAFQDVSDTQGRDITHLMQALAELRSLYSLLYWLLIVALFLAAFFLILAPTAAAVG